MVSLLDEHISGFDNTAQINKIRHGISQKCYEASCMKKGNILRLCVPTGGGKTLSTLRFALNHANANNMDKIIYVLPYTSIIEQNAKTVRDILDNNNINNIVLESHSNLAADLRTDEYEQVSVNWNAPVVFTTIVQFMETIFSDIIRQNRRLHAMTNSILIFDEVQCIPTNCLYMFNDFLRFITSVGRSTAILCTATQPLLDKIPIDKHGADHSIVFYAGDKIDIDEAELFIQLKRVNVIDKRIPGGWDDQKIGDFIRANNSKSILIIVNTKKECMDIIFTPSGI